MLLAQAALPGAIEAATVDHGLRPEAAAEARFVAGICAARGIPHEILSVEVAPGNVQDRARQARYAALAQWLERRGLDALATAHHADDQAETLLMRLNRASGLAGLAGIRPRTFVPDREHLLLRPLLGWRQAELEEVVARAGIEPVRDPSNADPGFDRVRIRQGLAGTPWINVSGLAASAGNLADAEDALAWATAREYAERVSQAGAGLRYSPLAPSAICLRVVGRIIAELGQPARGGEVARLVTALEGGGEGNLGGVLARAGADGWVFAAEPPRRDGPAR